MSRTKQFIAVAAVPVFIALVFSTFSVTMAGASTNLVPQPGVSTTPVKMPPPPSLGAFTPAQIAAFHAPQQLVYSKLNEFLNRNPTTNAGISANGVLHLTVHLLAASPQPSPALAALISGARAAGIEVFTDTRSRSLADLAALKDRVLLSPIFKTNGIGYAIRPDINEVQISVLSLTPELTAAVAAEFGNAVKVVQQEVIHNA